MGPVIDHFLVIGSKFSGNIRRKLLSRLFEHSVKIQIKMQTYFNSDSILHCLALYVEGS